MKYFNNLINKFLSVSILLVTTNSFALSDMAEEGKELYSNANCTQCHGNINSFDFKNHKVKNKHDISQWVKNCDANLETGWFPEEQTNVAEYLNQKHYKY